LHKDPTRLDLKSKHIASYSATTVSQYTTVVVPIATSIKEDQSIKKFTKASSENAQPIGFYSPAGASINIRTAVSILTVASLVSKHTKNKLAS